MKKFGIIALAALLVFAFTMPAAAVENTFGGYFRTRAWIQDGFTGNDDDGSKDLSIIDQRTRLYYTAKFSDNFKFVNKFEYDMDWGVDGDIGVDFKGMEIKNSYVDFTTGAVNFKVGAHGGTIARGFIFSDDFAGATVTYKAENFTLPFYYIKAYEGGYDGNTDLNDQDFEWFALAPKFSMGATAINPYLAYIYSADGSGYNPRFNPTDETFGPGAEDVGIFFVGVDVDFSLGAAALWVSGIYEGGTIEYAASSDVDVSAFLVALGGSVPAGPAKVHGQVFYATGDDDPLDSDRDDYFVPTDSLYRGQSYYWAEILGYGIFDDDTPNGSPADKISNILAANIGVSFKATDNLKLVADLWYAALAEDDVNGDKDLGIEIDLKATYKIMDGLNLDVVGAYLLADDAMTGAAVDDTDAYEVGTRLSLSF